MLSTYSLHMSHMEMGIVHMSYLIKNKSRQGILSSMFLNKDICRLKLNYYSILNMNHNQCHTIGMDICILHIYFYYLKFICNSLQRIVSNISLCLNFDNKLLMNRSYIILESINSQCTVADRLCIENYTSNNIQGLSGMNYSINYL